jgi:hypothetical protein
MTRDPAKQKKYQKPKITSKVVRFITTAFTTPEPSEFFGPYREAPKRR